MAENQMGAPVWPTSLQRTPPSVHEDMIAQLRHHLSREPIDDVVVAQLRAALKACRESAEAARVAAQAIHRDATRTPARQAVEARAVALKVIAPALKKLDIARERMAGEIAKLELATAAPGIPAGYIGSMRAATRQMALAGMPAAERTKVLAAAVEKGDDLTLAAVLGEPSFISGLNEIEWDDLRLRWQRQAVPAELHRLTHLRSCTEPVDRAGRLLMMYAHALAPAAVAQAGEDAQRAADKAVADAVKAAAA